MPGIYYMNNDNTLTELEEHPYDSEDILQQIVSNYPELLTGVREKESGIRFLLVSREMGIPDSDSSGNRWSLDHLFIDDNAIPTLNKQQ